LTQALKQADVPYNTYAKWLKKQGNASAGTSSKAGKILRSGKTESEICKLLKDVAALRAGGMTRIQALKQMGVLSTTHEYWIRKYGKPVAAASAKEGGAKRKGKSEDEIRNLLREIAALRKAGSSIAQATKRMGVLRTTYNYWTKKYAEPALAASAKNTGGKKASSTAKLLAPAGKKLPLVSILKEMADNRERRQRLEEAEKQIRELDARYEILRKQLDR